MKPLHRTLASPEAGGTGQAGRQQAARGSLLLSSGDSGSQAIAQQEATVCSRKASGTAASSHPDPWAGTGHGMGAGSTTQHPHLLPTTRPLLVRARGRTACRRKVRAPPEPGPVGTAQRCLVLQHEARQRQHRCVSRPRGECFRTWQSPLPMHIKGSRKTYKEGL